MTVARILGYWVQSNGRANHTINILKSATKQVARMIHRITYHKQGMKEGDTIRLVQALVLCKVTYSLPFHVLNKSEEETIESIIRGAYKVAIGLPVSTPTQKLLDLGIYNTYPELKTAVLTAQRNRLSQTKAGREILSRVGFPPYPQNMDEVLVEIPDPVRSKISISPLPKNMDVKTNRKRREERVRWLRKTFKNKSNVLYVDASRYNFKRSVASVLSNDNCMVTCASLYTSSIAKAECFAIALAIKAQEQRDEPQTTIISDSQEACRFFLRGRLPIKISKFLGGSLTNKYRLIWCPGHAGLEGNESADACARGLTNRAELRQHIQSFETLQEEAIEEDNDPSRMAPREILANQRGMRQKYSAPHKSLEGEDAIDLRRIQTGVFPNLQRLHKIFPTLYGRACPWCGGSPSLYHISWGCLKRPPNLDTFLGQYKLCNTFEQWEAQLASSDPEVQLALLRHVRQTAAASGALDLGPHPSSS